MVTEKHQPTECRDECATHGIVVTGITKIKKEEVIDNSS
jgi:hypothetical protein